MTTHIHIYELADTDYDFFDIEDDLAPFPDDIGFDQDMLEDMVLNAIDENRAVTLDADSDFSARLLHHQIWGTEDMSIYVHKGRTFKAMVEAGYLEISPYTDENFSLHDSL